ncbi:MAG: FHA domain-containing protein [Deltaproteobacteria bacterium]|nr:MAG: FHA domain-containing protein [Deltaproteobacteria bacterium]
MEQQGLKEREVAAETPRPPEGFDQGAFEEILEEKRAVVRRLEKIEENKDKTKEKIYRKVKGEYEERLSGVMKRLKEHRSLLLDEARSLAQRRNEIEQRLTTLGEQFEELKFRRMIEEVTEEEFAAEEAPLKASMKEEEEEKKTLEEAEATLQRLFEEAYGETLDLSAVEPPHAQVQLEADEEIAPAEEEPFETSEEMEATGERPVSEEAWARKEEESSDDIFFEEFVSAEEGGEEADVIAALEEEEEEKIDFSSTVPSSDLDEQGFRVEINELSPADEVALPIDEAPAAHKPLRATLIISKGPDAGKRFVITEELISIGRNTKNDIQVNDPEVSRKHATIELENGQYVLKDNRSVNGCFVNGTKKEIAILKHNDEIVLGGTTLIFSLSEV